MPKKSERGVNLKVKRDLKILSKNTIMNIPKAGQKQVMTIFLSKNTEIEANLDFYEWIILGIHQCNGIRFPHCHYKLLFAVMLLA